MSKARRSHVSKTPAESEEYINKVMREEGPTSSYAHDPGPEGTDQVSRSGGVVPRHLTPTMQPGWLERLWEKHSTEVLVVVPLVGFLSWGGATLFSLNREVGVLRQQLENWDEKLEPLDEHDARLRDGLLQDFERALAPVKDNIARLEDRLDQLFDRHESSVAPPPAATPAPHRLPARK